MILNSKQLEELENIQDGSGEFEEESGDSEGYVEGVENALAWRRGMIERAVASIRKIVRKPIDSMEGLASGSLVYLKESKRFVRIHDNEDGNSELSFVSPAAPVILSSAKGDKTKKKAKPEKVAKEKAPAKHVEKTLPKPIKAEKEKIPSKAAAEQLTKLRVKEAMSAAKESASSKAKDRVAKAPVKEKAIATKAVAKKSIPTKTKAAAAPKKAVKKEKVAVKPKTKKVSTPVKPKPSKAAPKKPLAKKKPKRAASVRSGSFSSSKISDPVADPNGYIRGNFRLMSNKELSHVTGLSEHTIRRKLGEWGLRRI